MKGKSSEVSRTDLISEEAGIFRVARSIYNDPSIYKAEMENIFEQGWIYVCHESQIPKIGDYYATKAGRQPIFVIRQSRSKVGGFIDACSHRGALLSRSRRGCMRTITCRFHGWSFDLQGRCTKIKDEEAGWPEGVDRNRFSLKSLPKLEIYKGFVYASLSGEVPELKEALGEAKYFIDLVSDQSPEGMEIVPGSQSYMVDGNWKLQAENGVDGYHVSTVHRVFARAVEKREAMGDRGQLRNTEAERITGSVKTGVCDLGRGHMLLWANRGNPDVAPLNKSRSKLLKQYNKNKVDWMINKGRNLFLFPNMHLMDQSSTQIRVLIPHAPDRTEVRVYCIAPKGESRAARVARLRKFEDFFMVTGMATPDDMAALEDVQRGSGGKLVKWNEVDRGRSLMIKGADETVASIGADPISSNPNWTNETLYYGFYTKWLEAIT
ncbi:MAG: benzoate 1,2-dioxygenase large subunit [Rhodospirillaceae bacterium]|nr:benzoate 1,2-dioxygenase large subunit [Rhodospirillaceae bacterium]